MRIIKTASGKNKLRITKAEWIGIGKKSGWYVVALKQNRKCDRCGTELVRVRKSEEDPPQAIIVPELKWNEPLGQYSCRAYCPNCWNHKRNEPKPYPDKSESGGDMANWEIDNY